MVAIAVAGVPEEEEVQTLIDEARTGEFGRALVGTFSGAVLTCLIGGWATRRGCSRAAKDGPATSAELAERAGLDERYVREWLGAMATGGLFAYDAQTGAYALPPEHALLLTGHTSRNAAPMSQILNHFGTLLPRLTECFRHGGGVPYGAFRPRFTDRMDDVWRRMYDERLLDGFIAPVAGLAERLRAEIAVADIGCGTGHAANLLADAGFSTVEVLDSPRPQNCIYACRP